MWWFVAACTSSPVTTDVVAIGTDLDRPPTDAPAEQVVTFTTRDDVDLVGDLVAATDGAPGVVLLHMTPSGGWQRSDWPDSFIDALSARGWWVLNLDRRGAGDSGGAAADAYLGEGGQYDVEAAVVELQRQGAGEFAILGASNGTTSAWDYSTWAASEGLPVPVALGFLTGGVYTENQHPVGTEGPPIAFWYSTAEREWSVDQEGAAPPGRPSPSTAMEPTGPACSRRFPSFRTT